MEKINIAELLRNCPEGMELDCSIYNKVTLINVDDREDIVYPIKVFREDGNTIALTKYGQYTDADFAKCVIFPKGKTTWEGFVPPCEFKVGDVIQHKENTGWVCTIARVADRYYVEGHPTCYSIPFDKQDEYELIINKFDITTLKPFESKVLVRNYNDGMWMPTFWGKDIGDPNYRYLTSRGGYKQCIPYEGNEYLLGTTNDCDEFYKNW